MDFSEGETKNDQEVVPEEIRSNKGLNQELQESKEFLLTTLNSISDGVIITDLSGKIIRMNPRAEKLTGWSFSESKGKDFSDIFKIINSQTGEEVADLVDRVIKKGEVIGLANDTTLLARDGRRYQINDGAAPIKNQDGQLRGVVVVFSDISDKYRYLHKLEEQNLRLQALFENSSSAIALLDKEHRIKKINRSFEKTFKYSLSEIKGKHFDDVLNNSKKNSINRNLTRDVMQGKQVSSEGVRYDREGVAHQFLIKGIPIIINDKVEGIYAIYEDITDLKKANQNLKYQAFHDRLTGLHNRNYLDQELKKLNSGQVFPVSLLICDINGLKIVNESFGNSRGDLLLQQTAQLLKNSIRENDLLGRWSGDEFVIILPATTLIEAEDILRCIKKKVDKGDYEIPLSLGMGLASKKSKKEDIFDVLNRAEKAMFQNKLTSSKSEQNKILKGILNTLKAKSHETGEHAIRMMKLSLKLGKKIGLSSSNLNRLSLLSQLHDIGKTPISEEILKKQGKLIDKEWQEVKKHPEYGYRIATATSEFSVVAEEILSHHEHWDGSGYPRGLKGDDIPLLARIISIIDAFDVMINGRPYQEAKTFEEALAEIKRCSGSQFDPHLAECFILLME